MKMKSQPIAPSTVSRVLRNYPYKSVPIRNNPRTLCRSVLAVLSVLSVLSVSGCATEKIAESLSVKNVSGNGTVVDSRIGIDPDTKIPALKTVFISGDFATVKSGTNQVSYREESTASIWNASSVTKKRFLAITLTDKGDVPNTIRAVAEVFKTAEGAAAEKPAESKAKTAETAGKTAETAGAK